MSAADFSKLLLGYFLEIRFEYFIKKSSNLKIMFGNFIFKSSKISKVPPTKARDLGAKQAKANRVASPQPCISLVAAVFVEELKLLFDSCMLSNALYFMLYAF